MGGKIFEFNQKIEQQVRNAKGWEEFRNIFDSYLYWEDEGGKVPVEIDGKWNFLCRNGKLLSEIWFDKIPRPFFHGYAIVVLNGKFNVIDKTGRFVFDKWQSSKKCIEFFNNNLMRPQLIAKNKIQEIVKETVQKVLRTL